ncbi:MAG: TonB-dependent receptor plug domain-containing protein [Chitinophagaceae bacterium]
MALNTHAQVENKQDSIGKELEEIIISFNKWELKQNEVPNRITKINRTDIFFNNPQTAADLLNQTGTVYVQKSQLGGGSPMIRGFATNRVLLVVDGVRMNNAIYRSGNLQNVISVDALSIETAEVIFGPGSLIYGSDAVGGVMDFHTLHPRISKDTNKLFKTNLFSRYASANREQTVHADINIGGKKWAWVAAITHSSFGDLKMGKHGGQNNYLRKEFVERINGIDSIRNNTNPRIQRFSGYEQVNLLQKLRYKMNTHNDLLYSYTYARTGDAPRYDRLLQYRNGRLRFAEWYYGPMIWQMHHLQWVNTKKNKLYDEMRIIGALQLYRESRIDRTRNSILRQQQEETVHAYSINADANKNIGKAKLFYGLEYVFNKVGSTGTQENINTGVRQPMVSRYPNGSTWSTAGLYGSYKVDPHPKLTLSSGIRYSFNTLSANFDNRFIAFPFSSTQLQEGGLTGNAGLVYRVSPGWQINANMATGFRMPNVDDIGKLFETAAGIVTVPNPALRSEYAWNYELGLARNASYALQWEANIFYTKLNHAIIRRPASFNGADSIRFMGVMSRVESLQNAAYATVWGVQLSVSWQANEKLKFISHANWISGNETDDRNSVQVPLRHAPPFYGTSIARYQEKKWMGELSAVYNSTVTNEKLAPSEQAKPEIYAKHPQGRPYAPGWAVWNVRVSYQASAGFMVTAAWENITNQLYRPYSSGIVAAGSNLILSLKWSR